MNLKGSSTLNIDVKGRMVMGPTNFTKTAPSVTPEESDRLLAEWKSFMAALIFISNFSSDPEAVSYADRALQGSPTYRILVDKQAQEELDDPQDDPEAE